MAHIYSDHDVSRLLTPLLRAGGHVVVTAREAGMERAEDDEQVLFAAEQGWILVTHSVNDYALLHAAWIRWARAWNVAPRHAGIAVLPHGVPETNAALLTDLLDRGLPSENELFIWSRSTGWHRAGPA